MVYLLQWVAAGAWAAASGPQALHTTHGAANLPSAHAVHTAHTPPSHGFDDLGHPHGDHHCCAVGLGFTPPPTWPELPEAVPQSPLGHWTDLNPSPDLRPPIAGV